MSPIIPSRYGHPKYNIFPQKSRSAALGGIKSSQRGTPGTDAKSRRKQRIEENKLAVQPIEDEDADNFFSKQLAAARFQRNHRLVNVLFNDVVVEQEIQNEVDRLQACRKRIKIVTDQQLATEAEIARLNESFRDKKTKIQDDSKKFAERLAEFIANSKREIEQVKADTEVRKQQEAAQRLIAANDEIEANKARKSTSCDNQPNPLQNGTTHEHNTPMDIDSNTPNEDDHVRQVIDKLVSSVADSI